MPLSEVSFIHADQLLLDCPVILEGDHSPEVLRILEDATLLAWDHLLQSALDHKVDFLLVTGNSFLDSYQSLRAEKAILDGFTFLSEAGIPVFVLPGQEDSPQAWNRIADLPSNVTILEEETRTPVVIRRDKKTIATISLIHPDILSNDQQQSDSPLTDCMKLGILTGQKQSGPIEDLILPDYFSESTEPEFENLFSSTTFDQYHYIALSGLENSQTDYLDHGVAHSPGLLQPRKPTRENQDGFSLIRMDLEGRVQIENCEASPICWQKEEIEISRQDSKETFLMRCRNRIRSHRTGKLEKIRIVCWFVTGEGEAKEWVESSIGSKEFQDQLKKEWDEKSTLISPLFIRIPSPPENTDSETLAGKYVDAVSNQQQSAPHLIESFLEQLREENEDSELLETLSQEIDPEKIVRQSLTAGQKWFS